ncbi:MAG: NADH-ubiquinone oxidoreductase-F iron-sulfur binding region domain-containing protein [Eubacteriales bacterium]|jgi:NADH:ubiquinone oxidoreductase subunit F (NADH-binding)/(2Fe-2S) ferredoxin/NAD-dependent dihydropyrimidine dehydrogenase PreA subunit|nr:NADH-ubiquinone oxidoreductase-F iron-sulfur binding region domain-containing protein [Bacillota bacterium]MDP3050565.1 NADH-ubiquinone oxidoreductase-F iron-sulfur binding region domain-containing protein [Eubacteriales bacterium]MDZ4043242.1 NADH-ubiquinone oxidoreductase-F iron-sulfur binding region domain-containing protein [Eubacteriales bacterium]MDZ7609206.1 NADH-ubiquinone oxidoreductase-F iron-sulfur binding region domain-containing protein [Eubacteriales bacterium]
MNKPASAADLAALRARLMAERQPGCKTVKVCTGSACRSADALEVAQALSREVARAELPVAVEHTGCQGLCQLGPLVTVQPEGTFYGHVVPFDASKIVDLTVKRGQFVSHLACPHPETGRPVRSADDLPFYSSQTRLVLRYCGMIDPMRIEDYIEAGGYEALARVLQEMSPEDVIAGVKRSRLRGRGGAGFPTGQKWEGARKAKGRRKFVICNADEGDPGAFMDRALLEGDPHAVLEGMIICAYAVGNCREGFVYVREEYPLAVQTVGTAIEQARAMGLLGENILGSGLDFDIEIRRGAGAFICGESTALMFSIEGKRGMPRVTPPRSVESGLWGCPTCLNNVETFANIPLIINRGADWYVTHGTSGSKGTKVFALSGKVRYTGLIEVSMGISTRQVVFDIGGGIEGGKRFKAAQIGGPGGGCVPEEHLDLPIDFESLDAIGSAMGSGALVVVDETICMVDFARYFLQFTQQESCGQCPPCRIGTYQMLRILERIVEGKGNEGDLERLEDLGRLISETSLCGLGKVAPRPVLSTLRFFRSEYMSHIFEKRCPTGSCSALKRLVIGPDCSQCGLCAEVCPQHAVIEKQDGFTIDQVICDNCAACVTACPMECILEDTGEGEPNERNSADHPDH